ncbi:hypothetical protein SAMN05421503_1939 [Terribacillus aidingensis]|uniref:Uncharacterized protein n=1 Tax=Terribacillus aidingensis TaxID=586416 RepID=A0A285NT59_9BACI|nr:hypothetical protein [Terribacillus aidingensis]SNZ11056.1 hypothetical protein SAMN05421503_1939 [Terribacillus aidingensis]
MKYVVTILAMLTLFFGGILIGMEKEDVQQAELPASQQSEQLTASASIGIPESEAAMGEQINEKTAPISDEDADSSIIEQLASGLGSVFTGICSVIITAIEQLSIALFG